MDINEYLNSEEFKRKSKLIEDWYNQTTKPIIDRINEKYNKPSEAHIKAMTYIKAQSERNKQWEEFHKNKNNEKT